MHIEYPIKFEKNFKSSITSYFESLVLISELNVIQSLELPICFVQTTFTYVPKLDSAT